MLRYGVALPPKPFWIKNQFCHWKFTFSQHFSHNFWSPRNENHLYQVSVYHGCLTLFLTSSLKFMKIKITSPWWTLPFSHRKHIILQVPTLTMSQNLNHQWIQFLATNHSKPRQNFPKFMWRATSKNRESVFLDAVPPNIKPFSTKIGHFDMQLWALKLKFDMDDFRNAKRQTKS